jgi:LysM repeat protein
MNLYFHCFFNQEEVTMFAKRFLQIALILAVLAACLAIPRAASAAGPCGSTYVIQRGDWLSRIANRCGVTLSALCAANPGICYQRYIYPGQLLAIPGGSVPYYPPPPNCGLAWCQPSGTVNPYYFPPPSAFSYASMIVTPHVGGNYYSSLSHVGAQLIFENRVKNNGNVPLQIVANLTPPADWDVNAQYDDCSDSLAAGSSCTLTWVFTPQDSGQAYVRVYVRGHYTDSAGDDQRVTGSPAFFFNVLP